MAEALETDKATSGQANHTILFICVVVIVTLAAIFLGDAHDTTNSGASVMTGEQGLKVGVEGATSHPQQVLPK